MPFKNDFNTTNNIKALKKPKKYMKVKYATLQMKYVNFLENNN